MDIAKRITYVLLLLCLSGTHTFGQLQFSGKVVNEQREALFGVSIVVLNNGQRFITNQNGSFTFPINKGGTYQFLFFLPGYNQLSDSIVITKNNLSHTFVLSALQSELEEITVLEESTHGNLSRGSMRSIEGTAIYAGKKTELIEIEEINANKAINNPREIYAKIGGLNIWESDNSGLQLDIGGRGLSPSRTANFNTRQNGYDISADALGYPESYYTPPIAGVREIEVVRGAASLQYGTQFGGMLNFKMKSNQSASLISINTRQTIGSFGLFNSFTSVEGKKNKWSYYGFYQYKKGNGFRDNAGFTAHNAYFSARYKPNKKWSIQTDYTYLNYLAQQPGGLTDRQFEEDPYQSNRTRNWFKVNWNLIGLLADYSLSAKTKINSRFFGLLASRQALGNLTRIDRVDNLEANRDLIYGRFQNIGNETRLLHHYAIKESTASFLVGTRLYYGNTISQQGEADSESGPNFSFVDFDKNYLSDYKNPNINVAVFAENVFRINPLWSITPGVRFEYINTASKGNYRTANFHPNTGELLSELITDEDFNRPRSFVLGGIGTAYKLHEFAEVYANLSQNYKSITFSDLRIVNPTFEVDSTIKDERGYTADLGFRGRNNNKYRYEITGFFLKYSDRIGNRFIITENGVPKRQRTNISDSRTIGVESLFEVDFLALTNKTYSAGLIGFINVAYNDARYVNSDEAAFENKQVELVPEWLLKTGLTYKRSRWKIGGQFSYTSAQFTDATNAIKTSDAVHGIVPAYWVTDLNFTYQFKRFISIETGVNNLTDEQYFTRRAAGYPGPGIIPSAGRSFYCTLVGKF